MWYENERQTFEPFSNPDMNQLQVYYVKLQKQSIRKQSTKWKTLLFWLIWLQKCSQVAWVSSVEYFWGRQQSSWKINRRAAVASVDCGTKQSHAQVVKSSGRKQPDLISVPCAALIFRIILGHRGAPAGWSNTSSLLLLYNYNFQWLDYSFNLEVLVCNLNLCC